MIPARDESGRRVVRSFECERAWYSSLATTARFLPPASRSGDTQQTSSRDVDAACDALMLVQLYTIFVCNASESFSRERAGAKVWTRDVCELPRRFPIAPAQAGRRGRHHGTQQVVVTVATRSLTVKRGYHKISTFCPHRG
jgi:hypothetical protein